MTATPEQKLRDLAQDFHVAMLVTRTATGQLRSRPMALADVEPDGTLWFMTQRHSPKMDELEHNNQVNVAMMSSTKFVSVSGAASVVEDRKKIASLWNETWKIWFPEGQDDPTLVLVKVQGETGEYWDNSGSSGLKYLIEAGKAYLSRTRPDVEGDPKIHAKVDL